MCHRCQWPFVIDVDEDQPQESYTSAFRPVDAPFVPVPREKTWRDSEIIWGQK